MKRVSYIAPCAIFFSVFAYGLEDTKVDIADTLGEKLVTFLKTADKMSAYCRNADTRELYGEVDIGAERRKALTDILLKNESWSSIKLLCKPRPGFLVWISNGTNYADIYVCLECGIIEISFCEKNGNSIGGATLTLRNSFEFVKWIRETFPNDPRLDKLK